MPDAQTILMALEKGEVDLLYGADGDQIDMDSYKKLESEGKYVTDMSEPVASRAILLNAHQAITGDKNVRQVLNHIQKEEQEHGEKIYNYMASHGMYQVQ